MHWFDFGRGNNALRRQRVAVVLLLGTVGAFLARQPTALWADEGSATASSGKLAVPDDERLREAELTMRRTLGGEFRRARRPSERTALADQLLKRSRQQESAEDPAMRYVLCREAQNLAALANDLEQAFAAVDELALHFDVDEAELKVDALESTTPSLRDRQTSHSLAAAAFRLGAELNETNRFDLAERAAAVARTAARRAGDQRLGALADQVRQEYRSLQRQFAPLQEHAGALEENPDDPEARLQLGRFHCFVKGEWERGLTLLKAASDEKLKQLAERDLAGPSDPSEQMQLGDGWLSMADSQSSQHRTAILQRAKHWYTRALPELTGRLRDDVAQKMSRIPSSPAQLKITAVIGGPNELHLYPHEARWIITRGSGPTDLKLNGISWDVQESNRLPNAGATRYLPEGVNLASGRLNVNKWRGRIGLRVEPHHIVLWLIDGFAGMGDFDVVIEFSR
jgi:hypothetical protein